LNHSAVFLAPVEQRIGWDDFHLVALTAIDTDLPQGIRGVPGRAFDAVRQHVGDASTKGCTV
jgi:hypothetical protein